MRAVQYVLLGAVTAVLGAPVVAIAQDNPVTGAMPAPSFGGRLNGSYFRPRAGITAEFTVSNTAPRPGDVVSFHASDASDVALNYYWTFGDNTNASGRDVTHAYASGGYFNATLTVTDYSLRARTTAQVVGVVSAPTITGDFRVSVMTPRAGDVVLFESLDPMANVQSYSWTFSDGTVSSEPTVQHAFAAGTQIVTLRATDVFGQPAAPVSKTLTVSAAQTLNPTRRGFVLGLGDAVDVAPLPVTTGAPRRLAVASTNMGIVVVDEETSGWRIVGSEPTPQPAKFVGVYRRTVGSSPRDYAFVVSDAGAARILDITDPANILQLNVSLPYSAQRFACRNGVAYLANGVFGLQLIDFSNPSSPIARPAVTVTALDVAASQDGAYAFVVSGDSFKVISTSGATPAIVSSVPVTGAVGISAGTSGSVVAVARSSQTNAVQFYSVADPLHPSLLGSTASGPGAAYRVELSGPIALARNDYQSWFIDATSTSAPRAGAPMNWNTGEACGIGGTTIYSAFGSGIRKFESQQTSYEMRSTQDLRSCSAINAAGTAFAVAGQANGTYLIDASQRSMPMIASQLPYYGGLAIEGSLAAIATTTEVRLFDISNLTAPRALGIVNGLMSRDACISHDGYVYTASYDAGVGVILAANPSSPSLARMVDTAGSAHGVCLSADAAQSMLYVADDTGGLRCMDISGSRRSAPVQVGQVAMPQGDRAQFTACMGQHLFVAGASSLCIYSVSNPASPTLLQRITGSFPRPSVSDGRLFLARLEGGVDIMEWSSANSRYEVRRTIAAMSGRVEQVAVAGGFAICSELGTPAVVWSLSN